LQLRAWFFVGRLLAQSLFADMLIIGTLVADMATVRDLIIRRKPRRSFNVVNLLILAAMLLAMAGFVMFTLSRLNAPRTFTQTGGPNGAPSTMKSTDVDGPDASVLRTPVPLPMVSQPQVIKATPMPVATAVTRPMVAAQRAFSGGGNDGDSEARDAQLRRTQRMREEESAQRQRLADSMRSMGGIVLAETSQSESKPLAYRAPNGPVLPIGTRIPIELTQTLDSTFGGQFSVPVMSDVLDERRDRVLIPRGSTCYGTTTQGGVDGQARIYGEIELCKLPDLTRVSLDRFPLQDMDGATGLKARVDDHGAGRRNRGSAFSFVPSMLTGTLVPGIGGMVASSAALVVQSSSVGRAIPGPTLYVDASPQKPRAASILITKDVPWEVPS
jgi:type IV secretory pathway VirB10-like protein